MPATAPARATTVPPIRGRTSILPAAAVLLLAVGTLGVFTLINIALGSSGNAPTSLPIIVGGLKADPHAAQTVFRGWVGAGQPPANVAAALVAPVGARRLSVVATGGSGPGSSDYDLEVRVLVPARRAAVLGFYRDRFAALGWQRNSISGASATGTAELLYQQSGTDGFYWDAGVRARATASGATVYTYRLFQVADYS